MRILKNIAFIGLILIGCDSAHEVDVPAQPITLNYQICSDDCSKCTGQSRSAILQAQPNRTGSLVLKDTAAIGGADSYFLEECHFYSNNDWHCLVKPRVNETLSLPNLFAHSFYKREIGFKDGDYYIKNADTVPSAAQKLNPETIQLDVCLKPPL